MFPLWKLSAANDGFARENRVMGTGGRRRRRFRKEASRMDYAYQVIMKEAKYAT